MQPNHHFRVRVTRLILALLVLALVLWASHLEYETETSPATSTSTVCVEDMDCWDCETMGNRLCGPKGGE